MSDQTPLTSYYAVWGKPGPHHTTRWREAASREEKSMSAKTDSYHTWKILESIDLSTSNKREVIRSIEQQIERIDGIIAGDEQGALDMGFGTQVGLLRTVLSLLQK